MIEQTAWAAAVCAKEGTIGEILDVTAFDRWAAELIDMGDYWWDCFWRQMALIRG